MEYETVCPCCKKEIVIEVDNDWIQEVVNDWAEVRREGMREARD